jgi:hypothetical protein
VARALSAVAVVALLAAGCGTGKDEGISGGGKVIGRTVTVYSIVPDPAGSGRDFVDGEKLALSQANGRAGALAVNFSSLDTGDGSDETEAEAVRRAINDPQIIAAIAPATPVTVPLFNAAGILQVAPAGDRALARDANANPSGRPTLGAPEDEHVPDDFQTRFHDTFGRSPRPEAMTGYQAMRGIIRAVAAANPGNDRTKVIARYLAESPGAIR